MLSGTAPYIGVKMIGLKDTCKLIGVSIISFCAVFVCTLFLNFNIDIVRIKELITSQQGMALYDAQRVMGKAISTISGGCLLLTSVIMLFFYIKHYIDVHKKELGILKALGYSNLSVSKKFWVFGLSVLIGTGSGFLCSFVFMPIFYNSMNEDGILPEVPLHFNGILILYLVVIPSILFSLLSIIYSYHKLRCNTLELLRGKANVVYKKKKQNTKSDSTFLQDLKKGTVKSRTSLIFFIGFGSFCFSSMMQMSFSVIDMASEVFAFIIVVIGLILSCTTLILAITTVVNGNIKIISMMHVFGYTFSECSNAILNGYRIVAYVGFVIGTFYQYILMKMVVSIYSEDIELIPEVNFNIKALLIVLLAFVIIYELVMYSYSSRIKKILVKDIMLD